jgi:hypothetical protein
MISTRKRPLILATMLFPALARHSRSLPAQEATPAAPIRPSPPAQPASGPGGADYTYDEVVVDVYGAPDPHSTSGAGYWLFEPAAPRPGAPPADAPLPLVLFLVGGMNGRDPEGSQAWIDHLVRRGAVVVFPTGWSMSEIDETVFQVSTALAELERGGHAPVDLNRVAVVGQGHGGAMAAHLAAPPREGLPAPAALMVVTPMTPPIDQPSSLPADLAMLPATTRVVLVGADKALESGAELKAAWTALTQAGRVPAEQRSYVVLNSDAHGAPALVATEFVGLSFVYGPEPDALDWYGTWKFLDGMMGCAFDGQWCEYAFGNTPEQRYMGTWSDGVPVNEAIVAGELGTPTPEM